MTSFLLGRLLCHWIIFLALSFFVCFFLGKKFNFHSVVLGQEIVLTSRSSVILTHTNLLSYLHCKRPSQGQHLLLLLLSLQTSGNRKELPVKERPTSFQDSTQNLHPHFHFKFHRENIGCCLSCMECWNFYFCSIYFQLRMDQWDNNDIRTISMLWLRVLCSTSLP